MEIYIDENTTNLFSAVIRLRCPDRAVLTHEAADWTGASGSISPSSFSVLGPAWVVEPAPVGVDA